MVSVQGSAVVPARPDEVELALEVTYVDRTPHDALAEVATRSVAIEAVLAELGIEERLWTTSGAVVNEQTEWNRQTGEHVHRGYVASSRIALRLEDPGVIGNLMQEATRRAQARVSGPWWRIAPDNPARIAACAAAAVDARRKAEAYATALGARLGVVLDISEPGIAPPPVQRLDGARAMSAMSVESPAEINVHAGDLQVSASIIIRFALEQD
ncbi:MAG TPA: SIMPL domain-containing protein [Thermomicrobiales bacterium]|nr:SIMPL domain-containing protein [Thermomicrobiales bacterium]